MVDECCVDAGCCCVLGGWRGRLEEEGVEKVDEVVRGASPKRGCSVTLRGSRLGYMHLFPPPESARRCCETPAGMKGPWVHCMD